MFQIGDPSCIGKPGGIPFASFFVHKSFFGIRESDAITVLIPELWHRRVGFPEFLVMNFFGGHIFGEIVADVFHFSWFEFIHLFQHVIPGILCALSELSFPENFMEFSYLHGRFFVLIPRRNISTCMVSAVPRVHVEVLGFVWHFMNFDQGKDSWVHTGRGATVASLVLAQS